MLWESVVKVANFSVKKASDETFRPSTVEYRFIVGTIKKHSLRLVLKHTPIFKLEYVDNIL